MPQVNDLGRCLAALDQDSTLIAVIEMSQSSWLVAGIVPGIERHPAKSSNQIRQRCGGGCIPTTSPRGRRLTAGPRQRAGRAINRIAVALRPVATGCGWRAGCGRARSTPR